MLKQQYDSPSPNFVESIKKSIEKEVSEASSNVEKGRLFLTWILTKAFHATEDDAENGIIDGPNDHGIDAILEVHGTEMNFFRIFQSKYGQSHSPDAIIKFKSNIKKFLEQKPNELPDGRIRDALINIKKKNWYCESVYVTNNKVDFEGNENFQVYGIDQIIEKLWNEIIEPAQNKTETITLEDYMKYDKTIIGVISLTELGELVLRSKKYIFESNIRKLLPVKTKVNKQIRKTLNDEPEEVFYFNNGVTFVVKDFHELDDKKIKLIEPQIVNGAQTSSTIAEIVRGDRNIRGLIQITIIKEDATTTRNNITKYRNSQNAVKGKDLVSLEKFHSSIGGQLKNELNYFYEQQAGGWMALTDKEKESYKGNEIFDKYLPDKEDKRVIRAPDAIQAMVAAFEQNPAKPYGGASKFMPGGTEYAKIFKEDDSIDDDYRLLFYPYLVKSYCKKVFNYGTKKANMDEKKYAMLLFVTTYFQTLKDFIIKKTDLKKNPKELDRYFADFETNQKLLKLTDEILNEFFEYTKPIRQDDEHHDIMTLHNFFGSHVWNDTAKGILKSALKRRRDRFNEIRDSFKKLKNIK